MLERGPATNPLFDAFFAAAVQAGYPRTDDVNGYRQEGFAKFDRNIHRGRRLSAARAYLHPVMHRRNLAVRTLAHVTSVKFEGRRAVGVEYVQAGRGRHSVRAGEVILCGGAINTPQILQLSGVGSARLLESLGVAVVADLPGVGANLQDHLEVYVQFANRLPVSVDPGISWPKKLGVGVQWLLQRKGLGATNHFEGGGFCRSNADVDYPNLMFHFLPMAIRYDGSKPAAGHGYQVHVGPMYSDARGWVRIRSRDPMQHPALQFNYLSTDQDRREWVEAIRIARRILNQPAMEPYNGGEISPGAAVASDAEILDWVRRDAETALHPSCTAKMGRGRGCGARSCFDARARARGNTRRRCERFSLHPERQHVCARHDGGRKERGPDPRQHAAAAVGRAVLSLAGRQPDASAGRSAQPAGSRVMTPSALGYAPVRDDRRHTDRRARAKR